MWRTSTRSRGHLASPSKTRGHDWKPALSDAGNGRVSRHPVDIRSPEIPERIRRQRHGNGDWCAVRTLNRERDAVGSGGRGEFQPYTYAWHVAKFQNQGVRVRGLTTVPHALLGPFVNV